MAFRGGYHQTLRGRRQSLRRARPIRFVPNTKPAKSLSPSIKKRIVDNAQPWKTEQDAIKVRRAEIERESIREYDERHSAQYRWTMPADPAPYIHSSPINYGPDLVQPFAVEPVPVEAQTDLVQPFVIAPVPVDAYDAKPPCYSSSDEDEDEDMACNYNKSSHLKKAGSPEIKIESTSDQEPGMLTDQDSGSQSFYGYEQDGTPSLPSSATPPLVPGATVTYSEPSKPNHDADVEGCSSELIIAKSLAELDGMMELLEGKGGIGPILMQLELAISHIEPLKQRLMSVLVETRMAQTNLRRSIKKVNRGLSHVQGSK